jgi:hypothetical protein
VLIVASGPSGASLTIPETVKVIAVNGAIDGLARADYWFTLDPSPVNCARMQAPKPGTTYLCACGPQQAMTQRKTSTIFLKRTPGRGISTKPDQIFSGNSGFGALQVAFLLGAKRIGIIGVDANEEPYWHGPGQSKSLKQLPNTFASAVPQLMRTGVEVRLGTIYDVPRVTCFPKMKPAEVIEWLL